MRLVDVIAGARPNFMKIAPIIRALEARKHEQGALEYRLIHTGQHYDSLMSGTFFKQLGIPEPHVNLAVGSGTQAEQTASIMVRYERLLAKRPSDICLVVGDVTSTMACAIAAQKLRVTVVHVEAGIRSGDRTMPEEINRIVTDAIADHFFTTSATANENLLRSGVPLDRIHFVGNTMIDTLLANMERLRPPQFWGELGLEVGNYFVVTLHRPINVDESCHLSELLNAIHDSSRGLQVIFPVHPRAEKTLQRLSSIPATIRLVEPMAYLEFNYLVRHAKAVLTDSGGVTEETTVMGVPCVTLRDSTERPETVTVGTNELIGTDPASIGSALDKLFAGQWKRGGIPELWDGRSGERIVAILEKVF